MHRPLTVVAWMVAAASVVIAGLLWAESADPRPDPLFAPGKLLQCADDGFEEDDTMGTANPISLGIGQAHLHCDEDWVWYLANPGATYQITTLNLSGGADTVLELYLSGAGLVASDNDGGGGLASLITWTNGNDAFHWVRIKENNDEYQNGEGYHVKVECIANCGCPDDAYEQDDTASDATYIVAGSSQTHLHCDEDWIWYDALPGATYQIETSALLGGADTVLQLYGSGGLLTSDDNSGGGLASLITWSNASDTFHMVRISEYNEDYQEGEGYDVSVNCVYNCPCYDDWYEEDDAQGSATYIYVGQSAQVHKHCDEDWVYYWANAGATYAIETSNLVGGADTVLGLYDRTGALITSDNDGGSGSASLITWTNTAEPLLAVRVTEYGGDYQSGEGYDIKVDCTANCGCHDDEWEQDDLMVAGTYIKADGSPQTHLHCDEDWFRFPAHVFATYRLVTSNLKGGANTVLELHSSGGIIASDDNSGAGLGSLLVWTNEYGPAFWAGVRITEYGDDYQPGEGYDFSLECIDNCPCTDDSWEEDDLQSAANQIFPGDSAQVHDHCDPDWVYLLPTIGATYRVETSGLSGNADTVLALYGNGGLVATDDNSGVGLASLISWTASEDYYAIQVTEHSTYEHGMRYNLRVDCVDNCPCTDDGFEDDDFESDATLIALGSAQWHEHCDEDWVSFSPAVGATYRIETSDLAGNADTVLDLYGSGGLLMTDDDGGDGLASLITWTANQSYAAVRVSEHADDYQEGEGYLLRVDCVADCPCSDDTYEEDDVEAEATEIFPNADSAQVHLHCDEDWVFFPASIGATYRIATSNLSGDADTVLGLFGSGGLLMSDDDGGDGLASLITWTADQAYAAIRVTEHADDYQEGEGYHLRVDCVADCPCSDDDFEDDDSAGAAVTITVDGGAQSHQHCDEDWLRFYTATGATYRIETSSLVGGADTVLELYDDSGMLDADDNSGAGLASLITWTATSRAWHDVRVREYASDYQEGEGYDIAVSCILDCPSPEIFANGFESGDASAWVVVGGS